MAAMDKKKETEELKLNTEELASQHKLIMDSIKESYMKQ